MNRQEYVHALGYATETTKFYLMDEYKQKFPHDFEQANLENSTGNQERLFYTFLSLINALL